jgi:hypothetical protein
MYKESKGNLKESIKINKLEVLKINGQSRA